MEKLYKYKRERESTSESESERERETVKILGGAQCLHHILLPAKNATEMNSFMAQHIAFWLSAVVTGGQCSYDL